MIIWKSITFIQSLKWITDVILVNKFIHDDNILSLYIKYMVF